MAALDSFSQPSADGLIAAGVREDVARSFASPDGVLPRMRLLAWGWTQKGDRFKSPNDAAWWKRPYQYPLWNPLETYLDQLERAGNPPPAVIFDEELAKGDVAELSHSFPTVVTSDFKDVFEAPCPKWLIPPARGQLPIPNPDCLMREVKDRVEKVIPKRPSPGHPWWLLAVAALIVLSRRK